MKSNIGLFDRIVRIVVAAIIATLGYLNIVTGVVGIVLLAIAAILLLTTIIGFCPLYGALGINTNHSSHTTT